MWTPGHGGQAEIRWSGWQARSSRARTQASHTRSVTGTRDASVSVASPRSGKPGDYQAKFEHDSRDQTFIDPRASAETFGTAAQHRARCGRIVSPLPYITTLT